MYDVWDRSPGNLFDCFSENAGIMLVDLFQLRKIWIKV